MYTSVHRCGPSTAYFRQLEDKAHY
jgi:hypothetical protein